MPQALNRVSLDLDAVLVSKMDARAAARGCSRSKLARDILTLYFSRTPAPSPKVDPPMPIFSEAEAVSML